MGILPGLLTETKSLVPFYGHSARIAGLLLAAAVVCPPPRVSPATNQLVQVRHWSGQGVAPVYEGFDVNPDGSFNMWFGYMNRNYEEELDIPVGPDNTLRARRRSRSADAFHRRDGTRTSSAWSCRRTSATRSWCGR